MVNTTITAPGALTALALIYLKSNNTDIVEKIKLPDTFEQLDYVVPHTLVLKVLTRNLIMWDQVEANLDWVENQTPNILKMIFHSTSKAELKAALKTRINEIDIDYAAVATCIANIKAASILSIGFKFAGTHSLKAKQIILDTIHWFRKKIQVCPSTQPIGSQENAHTFANKNQIDKNTADSSLCICALALSMVMAGSCDVECFRALRILRKRFEVDMHFGYNQAVGLALGLLFLSNGSFTLSRSEKAIAGLLSAVYPIFPQSAQDNRYHLQALRHFYVFALETRLLQAKDIDTGAFVNIEATVELINQGEKSTVEVKTPAVINGQILSISVHSNPEYHDLFMCVGENDPNHRMQVDQTTTP